MHHLSITNNHQLHKEDNPIQRTRQGQWFLGRKSHQSGYDQTKWLQISLSRKHSCDADKNIEDFKIDSVRGEDIYFNHAKKYNYMKQIIDKYFDDAKNEKNYHNPEEIRHQSPPIKKYQTIIPRLVKPVKTIELKTINQSRNFEHRHKRKLLINRGSSNQKTNTDKNKKQQDEGLGFIRQNNTLTQQQQEQNELQVTRSLSFTKKSSVCLPPIDEIHEDKDEENSRYDSISYLNDSISYINESSLNMSSQLQKTPHYKNEAYTIEIVQRDGRPIHFLKTYEQKGMPILLRQKKARYIGVSSVWIQYKYDQKALISKIRPSIKDLLFKAQRIDADSKFYTLKPKKYHKKLLANRCQELKRVIRQLCITLKQYEGRIINNKINTSNLYLGKNQNWEIGEWGFASFRESHLIQGMQFENRMDPILKSQKQWFVPPQYMAPEIMRAVSLNEECDLMAFGSAPDIWSLGVTIFEIISIIPVWIVQKCVIHGKSMPTRSGLLAVNNRDIKKMLKREEKLGYLMEKIITQQCNDLQLDQSLLEVVYKCVRYDPSERPSYEQLIQMLK